MGDIKSRDREEADPHRYSPGGRPYTKDGINHRDMEVVMDKLKWDLLTETQGRLEADLIKSYLEAEGVEVELFQEAIGHHIYPVTVDGLGRVQVFVPKDKTRLAQRLLKSFQPNKDEA